MILLYILLSISWVFCHSFNKKKLFSNLISTFCQIIDNKYKLSFIYFRMKKKMNLNLLSQKHF